MKKRIIVSLLLALMSMGGNVNAAKFHLSKEAYRRYLVTRTRPYMNPNYNYYTAIKVNYVRPQTPCR